MHIGGIKLTLADRDAIMDGQRLNDLVIHFVQKVLKQQFPRVSVSTSPGEKEKTKSSFEQGRVQIVHSYGNHWIVATSIKSTSCGIKVYDSVYDVVDDHTALLITNLFGSLAHNCSDCEAVIYAIANAAAICFAQLLCISTKQ